jgi:outer membrane receptor protein involved in Fe transport
MKVGTLTTLLGSGSVAALLALAPAGASAQSTAADAQATPVQTESPDQPQTTTPEVESEVEQVVVTGSRIGRTSLTATSPVAVLGREDIALDRALNVEDVLNELPQFSNGIGAVSTGSDARGATTLDLRGLGQNRTLVLINGTRAVPFSFRNSVDVNAIPAPLIERVEVLTGGASAVYGADAVAGVVNFILRDDFEGFEANLTYNVSDEGDAANYGMNLTVGSNLDSGRGNVTGYLGWSKREGLFKSDRDFAAPEVNDLGVPNSTRPRGGQFTRSDNANVFNFGGALQPRFAFTEQGALTSAVQTSVFSPFEALVQPLERMTGAVFFNYDLIGSLEAYGRVTGSYTEIEDQLPPATSAVTFLVQRNNPFLTPELRTVVGGAFNRTSAGVLGGTDAFQASVSRAFVELGLIQYQTERTSFQGQFGLRGRVTDNVGWDGYLSTAAPATPWTSWERASSRRVAQAANATVDAAGRPVCFDPTGGCVPVNLFGPGSISPQALAFIRQPLQQSRERDQMVAAIAVTGETTDFFTLPAGPVGFALGYEYRDETGEVEFDSAIQRGQTFNQGGRPNFGGGFDVSELFGEINVPLLRDLPLVQRLNFEAAYRRSDYSTAGEVDAYKLGGAWAVNDSLRFRGAFQTVVRAPNIGELFGALGSVALPAAVTDPCTNPAVTGASADVCRATGAPAAPYVQNTVGALFLFGGNPNLQPEEGETYTVGAVFTPTFLPGFSATVDYYDIKIDNAINAVLPQPTLDTCYIIVRDAANPFCDRITRGANGQITAVNSTDVNVQLITVEGVDVSARYRFDLPDNLPGDRVVLDYAADFLMSQTFKNGAAASSVDCTGRFGAACALGGVSRVLPEYRHRVNAAWTDGPLTVRGTWRVIGEAEDASPTVFRVEKVETQHYFDLAASYDVNPSVRVIAGVENLFDEEPPILGGNAADANTFPATYDVIGRRLGVSVTLRR